MSAPDTVIRIATPADAVDLAGVLHAFNTEFETPTPGVEVLAQRLNSLLAEPSTFAILAGTPPIGCGLVTLRPNVWHAGLVAILDELYVAPARRNSGIGTSLIARFESECRTRGVVYIEINVDEGDTDARRFYERLGYSGVDPDTGEPALYYSHELD